MSKVLNGFLILLFCTSQLYGQAGSSPFTSRGVGDIFTPELAHNRAMGGIGISNGSYYYLNNVNPALLPYNTLTVFSAGFIGENRSIENNVSSETNGSGSLGYLATAFPIMQPTLGDTTSFFRWTTSIGLMPYSYVNYEFSFEQPVAGGDEDVRIQEDGSGGFTQLYWSNGFALNKNIGVGLKASYLFSSIESNFSNVVQIDGNNNFQANLKEQVSISDFTFGGGIHFKKDSIFNNKIQLNIGATYDFGGDISARRFQAIERLNQVGQVLDQDTIANNTRGKIKLPSSSGFGISMTNNKTWTAGVDFKFQKWTEYENFLGSNEGLANFTRMGLGGEWTPDPFSVTKYYQRITYRLGFHYENTPYNIENQAGNTNQVNELGINFGWSLPVSRLSSLDMAFTLGQRGNVDNTLLKEQYFKFYLGVTWNDKWFQKRKFN